VSEAWDDADDAEPPELDDELELGLDDDDDDDAWDEEERCCLYGAAAAI